MNIKKYTIKEFAADKKVTRKTVHEWLKKGLLKVEYLPSGRRLILEEIKDNG